ncbi:hypothetical protein B0A55_10332 [Friedmanniomyces simplex]|uniref:Uncharacterized protein n=1 Tax=Friedmanniomyces simplex TaxID=329884 RepID=A0A4U0X9X0_9PEZI|nr:hypothetical protein B0A55_10332 [Friedmanniomyces simplex]
MSGRTGSEAHDGRDLRFLAHARPDLERLEHQVVQSELGIEVVAFVDERQDGSGSPRAQMTRARRAWPGFLTHARPNLQRLEHRVVQSELGIDVVAFADERQDGSGSPRAQMTRARRARSLAYDADETSAVLGKCVTKREVLLLHPVLKAWPRTGDTSKACASLDDGVTVQQVLLLNPVLKR